MSSCVLSRPAFLDGLTSNAWVVGVPRLLELFLDLGRREQARAAELRALDLTGNQAERSLLQRKLREAGEQTAG